MKKQSRPKILVLTSSFPRGPEDETCGYIREFARRLASDFQVRVLAPPDKQAGDWPEDVFCLTRSPALLSDAFSPLQASRDFNLALRGAWPAKGAALLSLLAFSFEAFRLALSADLICSHWMLPSGLTGSVIARLTGKPHIVIEHSGALHLLARMRGGRSLARFITDSSRRIITVSEDLKRKLLRLSPCAGDKIEVLPMGINPAPLPGNRISSNNRKPTLLFIGRLTEIKGVEVLLRALEGLRGVRLIIAGDGELRQRLEALARELSVDVTFAGRVGADEREWLVNASDVVVIPSIVLRCGRTEGLPVVCLEAMAAGRPVIAARAGGLAEIIRDGQNGLLFEPGDHRMLADRLRLILNDSGLGERLSANAIQTAAAYDWSRVGARFMEIIKDTLRTNEPVIHCQGSRAKGRAN